MVSNIPGGSSFPPDSGELMRMNADAEKCDGEVDRARNNIILTFYPLWGGSKFICG